MDEKTAAQLSAINRQFYQTMAGSFSSTRTRLQPGVRKILKNLPTAARLLDLGCGNGNLAVALIQRGWQGSYLGVDASPALVEIALQAIVGSSDFTFLLSDLSAPDWSDAINRDTVLHQLIPFNYIFLFAVMHHLPGEAARLNLLSQIRTLLAPNGQFIHSQWQFLNSSRWSSRIQPWEAVGLSPADLDSGDYLLDWRHGGHGLRYVHHFNLPELENLALQAGFKIVETNYSDGEGGNLGLYQVWKLP